MGAGCIRSTVQTNDIDTKENDGIMIARWMIDHNLAPRHWSRLANARQYLTSTEYEQWQTILVKSSVVTKDFLMDDEVDESMSEGLRAVLGDLQQKGDGDRSQMTELVFQSLALDLSMASHSCQSPLHVAAREGNIWLVEWLLARHNAGGVNAVPAASAAALCHRDKSGVTPLLLAASRGHLELYELMQRHIQKSQFLLYVDRGNGGIGDTSLDVHRLNVAKKSVGSDLYPSVADVAIANGLVPFTASSAAGMNSTAEGSGLPTSLLAPASRQSRLSVVQDSSRSGSAAALPKYLHEVGGGGVHEATGVIANTKPEERSALFLADPITGHLPMSTALSYWADAQERYGYGGSSQRKWREQQPRALHPTRFQ
mmetsp:Transcript_22609/g.46358  ORF Transcript_22609/g.46358 Transcript_22609/m.46358 type:complete len:371 (-) Transcript_22609:133-1245(-)